MKHQKTEKILTQHPEGKKGVSISRAKYDFIRAAIIRSLEERGALTYTELAEKIERETAVGQFEGSIKWYTVSVKLDLEARGVIERIPKSRPQKVRLV